MTFCPRPWRARGARPKQTRSALVKCRRFLEYVDGRHRWFDIHISMSKSSGNKHPSQPIGTRCSPTVSGRIPIALRPFTVAGLRLQQPGAWNMPRQRLNWHVALCLRIPLRHVEARTLALGGQYPKAGMAQGIQTGGFHHDASQKSLPALLPTAVAALAMRWLVDGTGR